MKITYPDHLGGVGSAILALFGRQPIERHPLFALLASETTTDRQRAFVALQIYHVVSCFPRFLAALIGNLEDLGARLPLVGNLLEEHGNLDPAKAHVQSYVEFMTVRGIPTDAIRASRPIAPVIAYNRAVLDLCGRRDPLEGLAAMGVIEDIVARVSPIVNGLFAPRSTPSQDFFDDHEQLDVGHAVEIYELVAPHYHGDGKARIDLGLELGLYYHAGMYEDVARAAAAL